MHNINLKCKPSTCRMLFAAATDHRFLDVGYTLDFTNKALEALDELEWENNKSLVAVALDNEKGVRVLTPQQQKTNDNNNQKDKKPKQTWSVASPDRDALVAMLLGDDPQSIVNALLEELRQGKGL